MNMRIPAGGFGPHPSVPIQPLQPSIPSVPPIAVDSQGVPAPVSGNRVPRWFKPLTASETGTPDRAGGTGGSRPLTSDSRKNVGAKQSTPISPPLHPSAELEIGEDGEVALSVRSMAGFTQNVDTIAVMLSQAIRQTGIRPREMTIAAHPESAATFRELHAESDNPFSRCVTKALEECGLIPLKFDLDESQNAVPRLVAMVTPPGPESFQSMSSLSDGRTLTDTWQKLEMQQGTTPGGLYRRTTAAGKVAKFYVAFPPKDVQVHCARVSAELFRALGHSCAQYEIVKHGNPEIVDFSYTGIESSATLAIASPFLDDLAGTADTLERQNKETATEFFKTIAAHLLLANWDALGATGWYNLGIKNDGGVVQMDFGGALLTRARWDSPPKPEALLNQLTEANTFFDPAMNPMITMAAQLAGYNDVLDVPNFREQVENIVALRQRYGGWDDFVTKVDPLLTGDDREAIVGMLEARTEKLRELATHVHPQR